MCSICHNVTFFQYFIWIFSLFILFFFFLHFFPTDKTTLPSKTRPWFDVHRSSILKVHACDFSKQSSNLSWHWQYFQICLFQTSVKLTNPFCCSKQFFNTYCVSFNLWTILSHVFLKMHISENMSILSLSKSQKVWKKN